MSRPSPAIQTITRSDGDKTLAKQRLGRPLAPHLAIYKWQTTSVLSTLQRITGVVLSGGGLHLRLHLPCINSLWVGYNICEHGSNLWRMAAGS